VADRYLVTDLLGEGGMGTVYLARHVRLPQQAAIKVLRREMLTDSSAVARFNREAANASRIDHDRVARVYDFGETADGVVYLAMEYVPGKTLKALLAEGGALEPARAASLVRQIAEGLDAAHRIGIVHRDLKPDNVMVIRDADGEERVKVLDFGIAKAFGEAGGGAGQALTRTGFVVGTPEFMSPEQLLGGVLDARSDVYGLGIVAYQCLTGELPFATDAADFGVATRLVTPPRPLTAVRPSVRWPAAVQSVLDQALSRRPEDRPATAGAFARALSAAIDAWETRDAAFGAYAPPAPSAVLPAPVPRLPDDAPPPVAPGPAPGAGVATASGGRRTVLVAVAAVLFVAAGTGAALVAARRAAAPSTVAPPPARAPVSAAGERTTPTSRSDSGGSAPNVAPPVQANRAVPNAPSVTSVPSDRSGRAVEVAAGSATPRSQQSQSPPPAASTPPARAATGDGAAARRALDSITATFDPALVENAAAQEAAARRAVPALRALLPRLPAADDSTWAEVHLAEALLLAGDRSAACEANRRARALARSTAQRQAVTRFDETVGCGG
jgi:serine/threonine-protein kinase